MATLVFALGTENKMKVSALEDFLKESGYVDVMYKYFGLEKTPYEVLTLTIPSNVSDQPKSLEETLQGNPLSAIFLIFQVQEIVPKELSNKQPSNDLVLKSLVLVLRVASLQFLAQNKRTLLASTLMSQQPLSTMVPSMP